MQRIITAALFMVGFSALAACNTIDGLGEDVQGGGEVISDTANEVQQEIVN